MGRKFGVVEGGSKGKGKGGFMGMGGGGGMESVWGAEEGDMGGGGNGEGMSVDERFGM